MFFRSNSICLLLTVIFVFTFPKISLPQYSHLDSLDGRFALQFQITENFQLTNFQGTVFSGKYHFSTRDAIRLGISLNFGDAEYETTVTRLDTLVTDKSTGDVEGFRITINTQYIRYIKVIDNISFVGGIGPFLQLYDTNSVTTIDENGEEVTRETNRNGYSTGADLVFGVEWWFYKFMSLSADYGLKISYSSIEDKFKDDKIDGRSKSSSFDISGNHVNFGITIYF